jgi:hypothetical protein
MKDPILVPCDKVRNVQQETAQKEAKESNDDKQNYI